jgi:hypothetical protein
MATNAWLMVVRYPGLDLAHDLLVQPWPGDRLEPVGF